MTFDGTHDESPSAQHSPDDTRKRLAGWQKLAEERAAALREAEARLAQLETEIDALRYEPDPQPIEEPDPAEAEPPARIDANSPRRPIYTNAPKQIDEMSTDELVENLRKQVPTGWPGY